MVRTVKSVDVDPVEDRFSSEGMMEWLATQDELLRAYQGEWVAFVGHDAVAHAPSFLEVMQQVESLGVEEPFLVPVAPDLPFVG